MPFLQDVPSSPATSRMREVSPPILIGACMVVLAVIAFVVYGALSLFTSDSEFDVVMGEESTELDAPTQVEAPEAKVYVHVSGCVTKPGVYSVNEGSRVYDAIETAGGFTEEAALEALNLARLVQDGEQIVVPSQADVEQGTIAPEATSSDQTMGGSTSSLVNINQATLSELTQLPGIGEATAQKIIADREQNGWFNSIEELKRVSGIGDKKFEALADLICI